MANPDTTPPVPPMPPRDETGHKGTFGTVAVFGGRAAMDSRMLGGVALTAMAALRAGCGLCKIAAPEPVLDAILTVATSATGIPLAVDHERTLIPHEAARALDAAVEDADCIAIGPGLGVDEGVRALSLRAVNQEQTPVVVDADALNALSTMPELHRDFHAQAILTPHPGEYRRLAQALGIEKDGADPEQRADAAETLARALGCVVVLKGQGAVVTDGHRTWARTAGNPALGTGGTGDVLTGVIAGIVAQHHRRPIPAGSRTVTSEQRGGLSLFDCARLGVEAHAIAAEIWTTSSGTRGGMLARELADLIPLAVQRLRA